LVGVQLHTASIGARENDDEIMLHCIR
jgi:hypothetical protein